MVYDHNKEGSLERLLVETKTIETITSEGAWRKKFVVQGGEGVKADEILLKRYPVDSNDPFVNFAEIYIKGY